MTVDNIFCLPPQELWELFLQELQQNAGFVCEAVSRQVGYIQGITGGCEQTRVPMGTDETHGPQWDCRRPNELDQ